MTVLARRRKFLVAKHPIDSFYRGRAFVITRQFMSYGRLVPLHRGFDRLGKHGGQSLWLDQQLDASSGARRSPDQACAFESEHHLVDGWWSDAEVTLHVGFGWSAAEDAGIGMDEGKILALFGGEGRDRGVHVT